MAVSSNSWAGGDHDGDDDDEEDGDVDGDNGEDDGDNDEDGDENLCIAATQRKKETLGGRR